VTNSGNVDLSEVAVVDDQVVEVSCPTGSLPPGEAMECSASGTATPGQYHNIGTASGTFEGILVVVEDHSHYYGGVLQQTYLPLIVRQQ
jgi:hypothetical protein